MKNESPIDGIGAPANRVPFSSHATVELCPLNRLVAYQRNPRKNEQAVDRMVAAIQQFGFKVPILARSGGEIVYGQLRIKAAKRLGIQEVPVILCHEWTPVQVNKEKRNP